MSAPPIEIDAGRAGVLGMPPARFLKRYWQKHPLLIRGAFAGVACPITPNDLAGLATLPDAPSRLVRYARKTDRWRVATGPFQDDDFARLPARDWTLLVQDVDKHDADVRALLAHFAFLPSWRLDDVMISYAVPGGSVGAHIDRYDVFLLQGQGTRRWQIDTSPQPDERFRDDAPIKLLRRFEATHSFDVGPGDMLYLPPNVPHFGEAIDACLTLSVGMRAPAAAELLGAWAGSMLHANDALRYADPDLELRKSPGEIVAVDLVRLRRALASAIQASDEDLGDFFARYLSQYRQGVAPKRRQPANLGAMIERGEAWRPAIRLNWRRLTDGGAALYGDGEALPVSVRVAQTACGDCDLRWAAEASVEERAQLQQVWRRGWVAKSG
jgi:50S ribosomal protein L16 3-hydroxylase